MSHSCYGGDVLKPKPKNPAPHADWGAPKAYDGKTLGISTLAITSWGANPYIQLYLGTSPPNITTVRIVARTDSSQYQTQNLAVYLSQTTSFLSPTNLCEAGITFGIPGEIATVKCPLGLSSNYLTVQMNATGYMAVEEITALYEGEHSDVLAACAVHIHALHLGAQHSSCIHLASPGSAVPCMYHNTIHPVCQQIPRLWDPHHPRHTHTPERSQEPCSTLRCAALTRFHNCACSLSMPAAAAACL